MYPFRAKRPHQIELTATPGTTDVLRPTTGRTLVKLLTSAIRARPEIFCLPVVQTLYLAHSLPPHSTRHQSMEAPAKSKHSFLKAISPAQRRAHLLEPEQGAGCHARYALPSYIYIDIQTSHRKCSNISAKIIADFSHHRLSPTKMRVIYLHLFLQFAVSAQTTREPRGINPLQVTTGAVLPSGHLGLTQRRHSDLTAGP